ncbi:hypothetical protein ACHAWF_001926 [Thalassiosira exigua]
MDRRHRYPLGHGLIAWIKADLTGQSLFYFQHISGEVKSSDVHCSMGPVMDLMEDDEYNGFVHMNAQFEECYKMPTRADGQTVNCRKHL